MEEIRISDIINEIHGIADPGLAYNWDNVGFQVGDGNQKVRKILLTLDVTVGAIEKAIKQNVDLIISHHPLIFRPLKKVTDPKIISLIKNNIGVLCAHTNLDVIKDGVNYALAEKIGLKNLKFLSTELDIIQYHVAVYVPESGLEIVKQGIFEAGAGLIGNYQNCSSEYAVQGQFTPMKGSNPISGGIDRSETVKEIKLEFFVESFLLQKVLNSILKFHPYETPVYAVYPQKNISNNFGLGLIGDLEEKITLKQLAENIKIKLKAPIVKLWLAGKCEDTFVRRVAICGGSGTSLLPKTIGKADVFVSADFTYHTILDSPIPLIDSGHFHTENLVLQKIRKLLAKFPVEIIEYSAEEHEINNLKLV